ncbi:hypothetical protein AGLY_000851 [Aphis glycines]|uniref:Uncharacterized protein n=1 Tax=Aphis glycines TaxID=307491 RepID=A0A6G0U857_APHGL|nr:hypothetical protein AGLY_000851 [Aphis glycines]
MNEKQIKINEKVIGSPQVFLNKNIIPKEDSFKYLDVYLDKILTWATHIKIKRRSLNLKLYKCRHLLRSNVKFKNKLRIYKQVIQPAVLLPMANNKSLVINHTLHSDFNICSLPTFPHIYILNFHTHSHPKPLISNLFFITIPENSPQCLKRNWSLSNILTIFEFTLIKISAQCIAIVIARKKNVTSISFINYDRLEKIIIVQFIVFQKLSGGLHSISHLAADSIDMFNKKNSCDHSFQRLSGWRISEYEIFDHPHSSPVSIQLCLNPLNIFHPYWLKSRKKNQSCQLNQRVIMKKDLSLGCIYATKYDAKFKKTPLEKMTYL